MSGNESKTPEFLQIKGYKYRAKMLIAAAVLLIIVILLISLIIHGISSAIKGAARSKDDASDTDTSASAEVTSAVSSQPVVSNEPVSEVSSVPVVKEEKFDADGKLVIDTDTLDGKKAIAITFDDGPSEYTQALVEGLNERGARATFFMVGSNVSQYPDTVALMASSGHQIGNHTFNHTDIASAGLSAAQDEISKTDDAIAAACGQRSTAFRPPYGSFTDEIAKKIDKTFTIWSLDTLDWKVRDAGRIKNTIVSQSRDGSIILLHDLYKTSVDGALAAIDELQGEGFTFVTVDELMTRYGYPINPGPHSAQYAVYETNSPHAGEYAEDMKRDLEKGQTSSASAGSFYFDRQTDTDTDTSSDKKSSDSDVWEDEGYYDDYYYENETSSIRTVETHSDSDRLVY